MPRVTLRIAVACCVLAGCQADEQPASGPPAATDSVAADSLFSPDEDQVNLPTSRIYYTLTSHDWYARGEPLVHDGRPFEPEGMPVNASLTDMTKAGEYQGVEFYTHATDADAAVYVPVFDGYWQRFQAAAGSVAVPADADDVTADSTATPD